MQSFCPHCGAPRTVAGAFCAACGKRQQQQEPPSEWQVVTGPLPDSAPAVSAPTPPGKSVWRQAGRRILPMLFTMLPAWVLHTYLLVVKNEGYSGFQHWSSPYINVQGNGLGSTLAFGLGSAALWSVLFSLWSQGPMATLKYLAGAPGRCWPALFSKDPDSRLGLALGLGLTLLGCRWLGLASQSRLLLAGACLLWGTGPLGTLASQLLNDRAEGLRAKFKTVDFPKLSASLVASLPLAFLASWLLSTWMADKLGWLALAYVGYRLYPRTGAAASLFWLSCWWLLGHTLGHPAWADDGGWVEATGDGGLSGDNILKWWTSVGSGRAIGQGLVPAAAAALGAGLAPTLKGQDPNRIIGHILQISRDHFQLQVGQTAELEVSVWSVTAGGAQAPASSAAIQLAAPSWEGLSITPTSGTGSMHVSLRWEGSSAPPPDQPLPLLVTASAGATTHRASIQIQLTGGDYELVVTVHSGSF